MSLLNVFINHQWPLLAGIILLYLLRRFHQYFRIRHFGGPWTAALTSIPQSIHTLKGNAHTWHHDISERYGPIARIGPYSLITSSADLWIHVNTKPGYKRAPWYQAMRLEHRRDHIVSQRDTKLHDERRKQIAPGYSGRENKTLEPTIDALLTDLLTLLRTRYLSIPTHDTKPMDLSKKIQFLTLDIISAIGTGQAFGMLRADKDIHHYIRSSEQGLLLNAKFTGLGLIWLLHVPVLGKWLAPKATDGNGFGAMMRECFGVVDRRFGEETGEVKGDGGGDREGKRDMLASFIRHKLKREDVKSEVLETLIAGSDTTAGALRGTMLYVMANKRVCVRLQEEIDAAVREGRVSGEGIVPYAVAKQLPYLQAVVREGMRIFPPVMPILPKVMPAGGDTVMVDGKPVFLPGGVEIGYSWLAMHRNKKVFGEDADLFRPERWFEPDQEKLAVMVRVNNLIFGHGRWECLGKNVAQMELYKTFFELFRHFDWAMARPTQPWRVQNSNGVWLINDMWVTVTAR